MSCMCLAAQHGARVLKVVNCHKTPCKPVCQWLDAYWLGLSQGYFTDVLLAGGWDSTVHVNLAED